MNKKDHYLNNLSGQRSWYIYSRKFEDVKSYEFWFKEYVDSIGLNINSLHEFQLSINILKFIAPYFSFLKIKQLFKL